MNTIIDFINMQWIANLGWSLLHTLWQGVIVAIIITAVLRFVPTSKANLRYAISLGAMSTIVLLFVSTFIYLGLNNSQQTILEPTLLNPTFADQNIFINATLPESIPSLFTSVTVFLNTHIYKIFTIWLIGATLLFTRLVGAFWYIEKLKRNSTFLSGTILDHLNQLAYQLQIPKWIDLAENSSISSPLVIGVFKPIILIPAGMLTGLSTEQIESIFIHELTHIKRHDYLVNVIQSIVEVVLFFNPFVMMLSNLLRKERENCCDDVVLNKLNNPTLYAQTLAQLEEYKHNQLAISFAGNKNYLLNRIKRIMESTAKKQNGKGRFLPVILLVVGLISASWLSFSPAGQEKEQPKNITNVKEVPTILNQIDTIPKVKEVPLFPKPVEPIEVDDFEMDFDEPLAFGFDIEPVFEIDQFVFDMEPMEVNTMFLDTIPPIYWEKFDKELHENFNEKYLENMEVLKRSMRELERSMSLLHHDERITKETEEKIRRAEKIHLEKLKSLAKLYQTDILEHQQEAMLKAQAKMEEVQAINNVKMKEMEEKMKAFEKTMKEYEKELKEELVKDGYIKKGEDDINIHWKNDELEINGKKIKEKDQQKYKALQKKYFKEGNMNWE